MFKIFKQVSSLLVASLLAGSIVTRTSVALAAVSNSAPTAKISFTFDDGLASAITQAAPTLAKYGFAGTNYVTTSCIGMTTAPNTCHANNDAIYMSWAQVAQLQTTYKWEIGSHTATHPYLASSDASDGQPNTLTPAQVTQELVDSKSTLAAHGINATAFASPYGDYNPAVLAQIAKYYTSHRGFADTGYNAWPNSDYLIRNQQVQAGVSVATVKGYIDSAIANNQWLVLTFHDIKTKASNNPDDYEYSTAKLDQIAAYVKSKNVAVPTISQGLVTSTTNLLANSSFNNGLADGWSTDSPTNITKDSGNNGSYPDPTNAIKLVSGAKENHLFSPRVAVNSAATYMLKNFLNVQQITSGEVGFYVDEYDANGNWISGQYKKAERSTFAEELNFIYKPTASNVATASLQIFSTANSGITAYLDNVLWFSLTDTVPPTQTNLITNGTFDAGISGGWTTNSPTTITADADNNGSPANPANSVKLTSTTIDRHLFSPTVTIDSLKAYNLSSYLNIKQISTGEVGFYLDEYDANGNWISGQYKVAARNVGSNTIAFSYKATSTNVKTAKLQLIVQANSGVLAYYDNVQWTLQ